MSTALVGAAAQAPNWDWYFTRATSLIALVLLTVTIVLGVLGPLRVSTVVWPRFALRTLHRDVALLSLVMVAVHVVTAVLDGFVQIPLSAAFLPVGSSYRELWTGLGAVSFDLLLAIVATSLLRRRVGERRWRFVHWFTYVSWPFAVAHGLGAGSDSGSAWALALTVGCCVVVGVAALVRVQRAHRRPPAPARRPSGSRTAVSATAPPGS